MKRVLVTGSCGNIGANVVDLLEKRGYQVRGIDLDNKKNRQTATRWGERVDMCFGSICNDGLVAAVLRDVEDRKSTRLNSSHTDISRMPSSA